MNRTRRMTTVALLSALIAVMTVVPYTGYINYGAIEITTLHIPVLLGAVLLGPLCGAILGGVWGVTCMLRALTNPLWIMFVNPLISVVPSVLVGLAAGLLMRALKKTRVSGLAASAISAAAGTLCNTLLVLTAIQLLGGTLASYQAFYELFRSVIGYVIGVNGGLELVAAVIIVPAVYRALRGRLEA